MKHANSYLMNVGKKWIS